MGLHIRWRIHSILHIRRAPLEMTAGWDCRRWPGGMGWLIRRRSSELDLAPRRATTRRVATSGLVCRGVQTGPWAYWRQARPDTPLLGRNLLMERARA